MTRIAVSPQANADFVEILDRLHTLAGQSIAEDYASKLDSIYKRLAVFPQIGAPRPRLGSRTRIAVLSPYVVVYDYLRHEDTVQIVRIVDGRRNITRRLMHE